MPSTWEGELGDFEAAPSAIQTLNSPAEFRNFDLSGMGAGNDCDENSSLTCEADDTVPAVSAVTETSRDEPISVIGLSQKHFKTKLVNHFDILFRQNKIVWPSWTGLPVPSEYDDK